jgi:ABC-2 type transport system permease protein
MLHRILLIAKRDYVAVVFQKAFLIGLVVLPLLLGGGFVGLALLRVQQGPGEKQVVVIDHTRTAAGFVIETARQRSAAERDKASAQLVVPRYAFEELPLDESNPGGQRLALSDRVRKGELFAFIDIGPGVLHGEAGRVDFYTNAGNMGASLPWLHDVINSGLRKARLAQLGVDPSHFDEVLRDVPVVPMSLASKDEKTGKIRQGRNRNLVEGAVPAVLMIMLTMIAMMGAAPMLSAVAEDKLQRVYEMLLASVTPFEIITGKVVASVGCSLTSSAFYVIGGLLALQGLAMIGAAPVELLPWFFVYVICQVTMLSAVGAAAGSACSAPRDAQQLTPLLIFPLMLPLFLLVPLVDQPNGYLATALSFFPPFTPAVMMLRQGLPGGVPGWEPWVGLMGMLVWTVVVTWAAARIFRVGILLQGQPPRLAEMLRWAARG